MNKKYIAGIVCILIVIALVVYASMAGKKSVPPTDGLTSEQTAGGAMEKASTGQQAGSSQNPAFVQAFINSHSTGQVIKFNLNNNTYYSFRTSFAAGAGTTLYDKSGNLAANCIGATGQEEQNQLCRQSGNGELIWKR